MIGTATVAYMQHLLHASTTLGVILGSKDLDPRTLSAGSGDERHEDRM